MAAETPQQKAKLLVHEYRLLLMESDSEYGEEILVSMLSKKAALIAVEQIINTLYEYHYDSQSGAYEFWQEVKTEIETYGKSNP